eukprot:RCo029230
MAENESKKTDDVDYLDPKQRPLVMRAWGYLMGVKAPEPLPPERAWMEWNMVDIEFNLKALGRHKWHPYDPELERWKNRKHMCRQANAELRKCFEKQGKDMQLNIAHTLCGEVRMELFKCLARHRKEQKALAAGQQGSQSPSAASSSSSASQPAK